MSNKVSKTDNTVNASDDVNLSSIDMAALNKQNAVRQFGRGVVGVASPSLTVKHLWVESGQKVSLKRFARQLATSGNDGNEVAKEWFLNKSGSKNQARSDANVAKAHLAAQASKGSGKKSS